MRNVTSVAIHPGLDMKERLIHAKIYLKAYWSRVVVIDDKWFTEEKLGEPVIPRRHTLVFPRMEQQGTGQQSMGAFTKDESMRLLQIYLAESRRACIQPLSGK